MPSNAKQMKYYFQYTFQWDINKKGIMKKKMKIKDKNNRKSGNQQEVGGNARPISETMRPIMI